MDDKERDEILWRLDERTEQIRTDIEEVKAVNQSQRESIQKNRDMAMENRRILNLMTFGIASFVTAFIGKFAGLVRF